MMILLIGTDQFEGIRVVSHFFNLTFYITAKQLVNFYHLII